MDLKELQKGVTAVIKDQESFLKIAAEQVADKLRQFCEENDIEKNTDEFDVVMGYGNMLAKHWFDFFLAFEKLRQQTDEPTELPFEGENDDE